MFPFFSSKVSDRLRRCRLVGSGVGLALLFLPGAHCAAAEESWAEALRRMPLPAGITELNRTNCVGLMLGAFGSNPVVKALVFMPGATDEFYLFRRAHARLTNAAPSLLEAVVALTNQTLIRASFLPPLLLLHTAEDPLEPDVAVQDEATATRLRKLPLAGHLLWNDCDWSVVQPALRWPLKIDVRPWHASADSWHFYRHSLGAWNLTGWEALQATALAGKSRFTVRRKQVVFDSDPRVRAAPPSEAIPPPP